MMWVGTIQPIHEKRHPRRPSFEKTDTELRKTIEDPVRQHTGRLRHYPERMTQGMDWIVNADGIHTQMVQAADVDRQRTAELLRLFIDGPINLRPQVAFDTLAVGWQHRSNHAQLFDRPPQLLDRGLWILNRDQSHPFDSRTHLGKFLVQPVVVRPTGSDRPVFGDDATDSQPGSRIDDRPINARIVHKLCPFFRPNSSRS